MAARSCQLRLRLRRARLAAPILAILALVAAMLLPALHPHHDTDAGCHAHLAADCCNELDDDCPGHGDHHPAPAPPHDERTCQLCQLIAITSVGLSPIPVVPVCTILPETISLAPVVAQCPTAQELPPSIPARGPPQI